MTRMNPAFSVCTSRLRLWLAVVSKVLLGIALYTTAGSLAGRETGPATHPAAQSASILSWMSSALHPEDQTELLTQQLTQEEKITLTQGEDFGATAGKLMDLGRFGLPLLLEADVV